MVVPFEDDDDRRAQLETLGSLFLVDGREVYGILRDEYLSADVGDGYGVESSMPTLTVCRTDVPDVRKGSEVVEVGESERRYSVVLPPEPDGAGDVKLRLNDQ